jgi:putative phosphoserine phosphatase/1-acylglycerol-3-phosphate O-acyltransferase
MQAGVPIVPVVIRNAGDLMWRGSFVIRPGTVDVAVLEPIPTDDWTVKTMRGRIEELHERYEQTLDDWPR